MAQSVIKSAQDQDMEFDGNISVFLGNTIVLEGLAR